MVFYLPFDFEVFIFAVAIGLCEQLASAVFDLVIHFRPG
jgi:hypothetical protein